MKFSLDICNLEEISSLSHSVVFLYFFAMITEEGFLISLCYSLELCIQMEYLSFFPLLFTSLLSTAICKASSDSHFTFLHFFFLGMVLILVSCTMPRTSVHRSSGTLSDLIPYDFTVEVTNRFKGLDLIDRVPEELWTEVRDIVQEAGIKTIPKKKKCKKANCCLRRPYK